MDGLITTIKKAAGNTGTVIVADPYRSMKLRRRTVYYKKDGAYVRIDKGWWKLVRSAKLCSSPDLYEFYVEKPWSN
jgi:hypothetical protein